MKRLGLVLSVIFLLLLSGVSLADTKSDQRVYDQAGLFSEEEVRKLEEEIQNLREDINMDVALVTILDAHGRTSERYADDFYDEMKIGTGEDASGLLFLMDMDNRELYISTCGQMIRLLTDERVEAMLDNAIGYMGDKDYVGCVRQLMEDTRQWYEKGIVKGQYNMDRDTGEISLYRGGRKRSIRWYEALIAAAVSAFCAGSVCLKVKKEYAMEDERRQASNYYMAYRADASFRFRDNRDVMKNSHVLRQVIPRSTYIGSGGSGSLGRSTTHRTGGRSHGGGGRKF